MMTVDFGDPVALFNAAIDLLNAEDWRGAAALVDPVSLRQFQRLIATLRKGQLSSRACADLPGIGSIKEFATLPAADAFASWLDGNSPRRRLEALAQSRGMSAEATASLLEARRFYYVVLAAAPDGENVTHILYRTAYASPPTWRDDYRRQIADQPVDEQEYSLDLAHGKTRIDHSSTPG